VMKTGESSEIFQSSSSYWDSKVKDFDAIYTGEGWPKPYKLLSDILRRDIFDRVNASVAIAKAYDRPISILDIGCGTCRLIEALHPTEHFVVGVDYSSEMLTKAKEILTAKGISEDSYRLIFGDVVNNWPNELDAYKKFEIVVMLGLVEYISDPVPLLQKMLRFNPDKILVSFCRAKTPRTYIRRLRYKIQGLDCPLFFYTQKEIQEIGEQLGAKSTKIQILGTLHFTEFSF